ncbi:MAG: hypothetical protein CVT85_01035 [Alphaproteobacteria bacterium HGW-Alphaproteobacteria-7]|nr:MAG: hypothetical protein CVT85_01035 [Alphaproteobacteria bacterium HGW-Alphaproteobacteria-7]
MRHTNLSGDFALISSPSFELRRQVGAVATASSKIAFCDELTENLLKGRMFCIALALFERGHIVIAPLHRDDRPRMRSCTSSAYLSVALLLRAPHS